MSSRLAQGVSIKVANGRWMQAAMRALEVLDKANTVIFLRRTVCAAMEYNVMIFLVGSLNQDRVATCGASIVSVDDR